jgi:hypothetical protein
MRDYKDQMKKHQKTVDKMMDILLWIAFILFSSNVIIQVIREISK